MDRIPLRLRLLFIVLVLVFCMGEAGAPGPKCAVYEDVRLYSYDSFATFAEATLMVSQGKPCRFLLQTEGQEPLDIDGITRANVADRVLESGSMAGPWDPAGDRNPFYSHYGLFYFEGQQLVVVSMSKYDDPKLILKDTKEELAFPISMARARQALGEPLELLDSWGKPHGAGCFCR